MTLRTTTRRAFAAITAGLIGAAGSTFGAGTAHAAFTSDRGGKITRAEVMERAQYWVDHQPGEYNQGGYSVGPADSKLYRRDCSGYVDMAWHTAEDHYTGNLADISSDVSLQDLKPGDILNYTAAHVVIFKSWSNTSKTRFNYYTFGSTPVQVVTNQRLDASSLDGHPFSLYTPMRYDKIADNADPTPEEPVLQPHLADVTGDGYTDLVGVKADGTMLLYSNNFNRDNGKPYSDVRQIGSGWGNFDRVIGADATGDGFRDIVATKPDGTLWLYANNIVRDSGKPYGDVRQIGSGWGNFAKIIPVDANGDGYTDLVGVKADGTMLLYSNNFNRDNGKPYGDVRQIGSGWGNFASITPVDANGDGYTDLVGVKADGTMLLYSNNFNRDNGKPYSDVRQIGSGWGNFASITPVDANGDGYTDLVGVKADGTMLLYSNNFNRDNGKPYSDVRQIGTGWNSFSNLL